MTPSRPVHLNMVCETRTLKVGLPCQGLARVGSMTGSESRFSIVVLGAGAPTTKLVTDDWSSYRDIPEIKHKPITVGPMGGTSDCPGPIACPSTSSPGVWR
jgi:hypothetical protein